MLVTLLALIVVTFTIRIDVNPRVVGSSRFQLVEASITDHAQGDTDRLLTSDDLGP